MLSPARQNKIAFWSGFLGAVAGCVYLNWRSFLNDQSPGIDSISQYGFPIPLYQAGGWVTIEEFLWIGLSFDLGFALGTGYALGWLCAYLWQASRPNQGPNAFE